MPQRVALFIDAQNVYRSARDCFGQTTGAKHVAGQFNPVALAELICRRPPPGTERTVSQVRVYTGRPESVKQPKAYAAHMRQCAAWERAGVVVVPRTLRYPANWPQERAQEKGVDVQLAVDFVAGAVDGHYDVGVIFSTDTDLLPALEFVATRYGGAPRAESAAWKAGRANRALRLTAPTPTWCHFPGLADYQAVHDGTDYNIG